MRWLAKLCQAKEWAGDLVRLVYAHGADFAAGYVNRAAECARAQAIDVVPASEGDDGFPFAALLVVGEAEHAGDRVAEKVFAFRWAIIAKRLRLPQVVNANSSAEVAAP